MRLLSHKYFQKTIYSVATLTNQEKHGLTFAVFQKLQSVKLSSSPTKYFPDLNFQKMER